MVSPCSEALSRWYGHIVAAFAEEGKQPGQHLVAVFHQGSVCVPFRGKERGALQVRKQRIVDLYRAGLLPQDEMESEAAEIRAEQQKLNPQLLEQCQELVPLVIDFAEVWDAATPLERKEMLRLMFQRINMKEGRIAAVQPTAAFYPLLVTAGATGIASEVTIFAPDLA